MSVIDKVYGTCCSIADAIEYIRKQNDESDMHCRLLNLLRYLRDRQEGVKPKYYKASRSVYSYWRCGHCGGRKVDVGDNYCPNCGYYIKWDNPRCLTGYDDPEDEPGEKEEEHETD